MIAEVVVATASANEVIRRAAAIGSTVAAEHADEVDRLARFPSEAIDALRGAGLLGAAVPVEHGGLGLGISALADIARVLAQSCAATAMVWAMHQIQVACIARHAHAAPFFDGYLREIATNQLLIASVTSEVGVGGDIRTSIAAVEDAGGGRRQLHKHGSTISYGAHADGYLITARRNPSASAEDQVLVLLRRGEASLEQTGGWDTLGMRGTCSPAFQVAGEFAPEQVLPTPFADICAETMVAYSHILWSACWLGIATDAVQRARMFTRTRVSQSVDRRLADAAALLQELRTNVFDCARVCENEHAGGASIGRALQMNQLKLAASDLVVRIVSLALSICGMAGYQNSGPYTLGRHLRDAYSAGCMINNERLREANATMLLLHKAV